MCFYLITDSVHVYKWAILTIRNALKFYPKQLHDLVLLKSSWHIMSSLYWMVHTYSVPECSHIRICYT